LRHYPKTTILIALLITLIIFAYHERRLLVVATFISSPVLSEAAAEPDSVIWFDDYFTIEYIDSQTIAIGEPRYHQQNYNYLILGEERAILFDTGPGVRDIKPVVEHLTNLPVVVTQSHLHFDHVGNHDKFETVAVPNLEYLQDQFSDGVLSLTHKQHLGFVEDIAAPDLNVTDWWSPGSKIDLGSRTLELIHAPGHTPDSIVLLDRENNLLFTGDFIYPGPLFAMLPGSNLADYLATTLRLIEATRSETRLLTAHRGSPAGAPILAQQDLLDLKGGLGKVLDGTLEGKGFYIRSYTINDHIELLLD
jgi:hydroxyacylglutathione hydrolase